MLQYLDMQTEVKLHVEDSDHIGPGVDAAILRIGPTSLFFRKDGVKMRALRDQLTAQIEEIENT